MLETVLFAADIPITRKRITVIVPGCMVPITADNCGDSFYLSMVVANAF